MTKKQAKAQFGKEGSYRLRRQWQKAIIRGKAPNNFKNQK